jgi:uncharacterized protein involved in outer membrane biogenesis
MVTWRGAQLGAKLFPLLRGELVADRVHLEGVDLQLVRRADGTANWQGIGSQQPSTPSTGETKFSIDGVEIEDGRISFVDEAIPRRIEVTGFHLQTDEISPGVPLTDTEIAGVLHMDGFAAAGVPFRLAVSRVELQKDFSSIAVKEFSASFGALELEGGIDGSLGDAPRLTGHI